MPAVRKRHVYYTPELAERICYHLASGRPLKEICREPDMPDESSVRAWALEDHEGFFALFSRAREIGAYAMADEIIEIADDARNDWMERNDPENPGWMVNTEAINRSRLRIDARKWLASKILPRVFGDRVEVENNTTVNWYIEGVAEAPTVEQWTQEARLLLAQPAGSAD